MCHGNMDQGLMMRDMERRLGAVTVTQHNGVQAVPFPQAGLRVSLREWMQVRLRGVLVRLNGKEERHV